MGWGVFGSAPFDFMSDTLRGMRGIFLDMHRRPEQLLAAEEKSAPYLRRGSHRVLPANGREIGVHASAPGIGWDSCP